MVGWTKWRKHKTGIADLILRLETNHSELIVIAKSVDRTLDVAQHELTHLWLLYERLSR